MPNAEFLTRIHDNTPEQNWSARIYHGLETGDRRRVLQNTLPGKDTAFSPGKQLINFPQDRVGNYNPLNLKFSENEIKDREVKELLTSLYDECGRYMDYDELGKIDTSVALMAYGHQNQLRENGDPYIPHLLKVALPLVKKFQVDWETVASALCHDLLEDSDKNGYPVAYTNLSKFLSHDIANTVNTLSKFRFGDTQVREEYVDDITRAELFKSLRDNPRAALIKIFDRLHNMQTIADMQDETVRKEKAYETLKYYVPLAQFLGIFDEARELAGLSLAVIDPEFTERLTRVLYEFEKSVNMEIAEFGGINYLELVRNKISQITGIDKKIIHIITPDIYSVYKRMGKKKEPTIADCYLVVDVDMDLKRSMEWLKKAWNHRFDLAMSEDFNSTVSMDLEDIYDKFINNRLYSLEFFMDANFGLETPLKINLYPSQGYELMQIPISDYYHRLGIDSYNKDEKITKERGLQKWQHIKNRLSLGSGDLEGGELGRKFLDIVLPGKISFFVIEKGNKRPWVIDENSSLMDILIDKYPGTDPGINESWMKAQTFKVNGRDVDVNYLVQPGDEINIIFSPRTEIKPNWIRAVNTSSNEYIDTMRRYFRGRLSGHKWAEVIHHQLREEATKILSSMMGSELVVNIEKSDNFLRLEIDSKEFIYRLALDKIEDQGLLAAIAGDLREYQRENLVLITFYFEKDDIGLTELVTHVFTAKGVNKRKISGSAGISEYDFPSISFAIDLGEIYIKKNKYPKIVKLLEEVIDEIRDQKSTLKDPYIIYPPTVKFTAGSGSGAAF